jgi:uncharacterized protein (DUF302 family)
VAFGIVKAAETVANLPEEARKQLLTALDEVDQSDVLRRVGQDIGRGIVEGIIDALKALKFWGKK